MVAMAGRNPKRAPLLKTNSMLGPGVPDTTNVIRIKSHQVCKVISVFSVKLGWGYTPRAKLRNKLFSKGRANDQCRYGAQNGKEGQGVSKTVQSHLEKKTDNMMHVEQNWG